MEMIVFLFFSPFIVGFLLIAVLWSRLNETRELAAGVRDKLGWESERITELEQTIRRMARQRSWATTEPEPAVEPVAPAAPVMEAKAIILAEPLAESVIEEPGVWLAVAAGEALDAELEPSELPMHARNPIEVASRVAVDEPEIEQPQVNAEPGIGWEARIGGQWLNKLGALVLVIGIALFLSYSFTQMGPLGRSATGLGVSAALLGAGFLWERREKYKAFAGGVMAAGWASLYATTYAMHAVDATKVIDNPVLGIVLMVMVAVAMVLHSLRYNVEALTSLAYACVFTALAVGESSTFTAVALVPLAASLLYLSQKMQWHGMALLGLAATYGTFLTRPDMGATLMAVQGMLLLYWAMFEAYDLLRVANHNEALPLHRLTFQVNAIAGLLSSAAVWQAKAPNSMGMFCAGASALYLGSTAIRLGLGGESMYELALAISAVAGGLGIFAHSSGAWAAVGLLVEAQVLYVLGHYGVGTHGKLRWARGLALLGFAATLVPIADAGHLESTGPLLLLAAMFYWNRAIAPDTAEANYLGYLAISAIGVVLYDRLEWRYVGAVWMALGVAAFEVGWRKRLEDFRWQGYGAAIAGATGLAFGFTDPHFDPHAWMVFLGAALALGAAWRATFGLHELAEVERSGIRTVGSLACAILLTLGLSYVLPYPHVGIAVLAASVVLFELAFRSAPAEMWLPAPGMNVWGLGVLWMGQSDAVSKHPTPATLATFAGAAAIFYWLTARRREAGSTADYFLRTISLWVGSLFAVTTLWMAMPDRYWPMAIAALALASFEVGMAIKGKHAAAADLLIHAEVMAVAATASLVLGELPIAAGVVAASAHAYLWLRTRKNWHIWLVSTLGALLLFVHVEGGMLTLSWSLEGLLLLGAGFLLRARPLRLAGLGLLALCIGKLFLYDLRNLETLYRILSFIGLGAILLGVSWIYTRFREELKQYL